MSKLHPEVKIEIKPSRSDGGLKSGHEWNALRNGSIIGTGWAAGDVKDAFEDAIDDLRMLGLVETTEAASG